MVDPVAPRRDQLEAITGGDYRLMIALERLFEVAGNLTPSQIVTLQEAIDQNEAAIVTNAGDILTNTGVIATNTADITTNTGNIATNTADIATNVADIATNTADILTNAGNISTNTANIASNLALIEEIMAGTDIAQAERVVFSTYGDTVSVEAKAKNLNKFGTNTSVGTTYETVAQFQGTSVNETFVTTNVIDSIASSSASDTTQTIRVEGHTIDGSGNLTFVVQDAVLNGQTEVTLTTPLARASRLQVKETGTFGTSPAPLVGTVSVYDNTGGQTGGVPTLDNATKVVLRPGFMQSNKCQTAISATDYWFISEINAGIGQAGGPADRVTFKLERRDIPSGGPWVPIGREIVVVTSQNGVSFQFMPFAIIPKNNDVRISAKTNASTSEVFAEMQGYLAAIV